VRGLDQIEADPGSARPLPGGRTREGLHTDGKAIKELAGRYGIHRLTGTSILRGLGIDLRQKGLTDEQVTEACRFYAEGWSLASLAERYGVEHMTVRRYLVQAGVVMRSAHQRCT
jgi:hypothetical protein